MFSPDGTLISASAAPHCGEGIDADDDDDDEDERRRSLSKESLRMVVERLFSRMTCPNHASFCLLIVARKVPVSPVYS